MPHRSAIACLIAVLLCPAQAPETRGILAPADESVVPAGSLKVIAKGTGKLQLDGKPVASTEPAPGVTTAVVQAEPGAHELSLADGQKIRFFAGKDNAPSGWKAFRPHPPAAACDTCHAVKDSAWALKRPSLVSICFPCHNRQEFPKTHTHNTDILTDCQICHMPHGSTEASHLKMTREVACKQCHG